MQIINYWTTVNLKAHCSITLRIENVLLHLYWNDGKYNGVQASGQYNEIFIVQDIIGNLYILENK